MSTAPGLLLRLFRKNVAGVIIPSEITFTGAVVRVAMPLAKAPSPTSCVVDALRVVLVFRCATFIDVWMESLMMMVGC